VSATPGPDEATAAAQGFAGRVDAFVYRIETTVVTVAAMVMTTTVTLDIVYRAFASPESQLARKLMTVGSWVGFEKTEALYGVLRDRGTPIVLIALAFLAGWAVFGAGRRRDGRPAPAAQGVGWGLATVVGCYGFIQFILNVSSQWVCTTLLLLCSGGYFAVSIRKKEWDSVVMAGVVAVVGSWACTKLPAQYIWSQELSLMLLAWVSFIGGSMATRMHKHIQVDALGKIVPTALKPWTRALGLLVTTIFCAYMTALAYEHVFGLRGDYASGEIRPATQIPAWTIIFSVLVAFSLMSVRFAAATLDAFRHPRATTQDLIH
jgi:C4-dicarboxylate transporter, DctQ subunit